MVFGIDIGTTSICLAVWDEATGLQPMIVSRGNEFMPGTFWQDQDSIWEKIQALLLEAEEAGYTPDRISAIGISSQMHGILYVDADGQAVSPYYTWKDENGRTQNADGISLERELSERLGSALYSGYGTVTHAYLQKTGQIPDTAVKMVNIGDYIAMRLTGRCAPLTHVTIAASFGGFDLERGQFAYEKLRKAGIAVSCYPEVTKQGAFCGFWKGIPVSCAFGDNQASIYGAQDDPAHQISINVGTGSQVSVCAEKILPSKGEIRPYFDEKYLYVGASLNGGKVYEKLADFFAETVYAFTGQKIMPYEEMERLVNASGKENGDPDIVPSLYGSRFGAAAGGEIRGLTPENFHPAALIRSYVHGMAEELYCLYREIPEEIRAGRVQIVASGNGIRKNALMRQAVEQVFGMPVHFGKAPEEAAAGAAKAAYEQLCRRN